MNTIAKTMGLPWRITPTVATKPTWYLALTLAVSVFIALQAGAVPVSLSDWWLPFATPSEEPLTGGAYVLWNLRLPRILFAALIGAALGLSGALTQGLFRNPLSDPGLLGITGGAACAAALSIVLLGHSSFHIPIAWRYWTLPAAAFVGALSVCFALNQLARWLTADSITGLLLTGIALNALAAAVIGLCTYLANDEQLRSLTFWTLGSLASASWSLVVVLLALLFFATLQTRRLVQAMNALALGEATAAHIGIDVRHLRNKTILLVAVLSSFAVAWCGMIGFIGLVAPHIVRRVVGPDQRWVAPLSMWVGALLLLVADTAARTLVIPAEIPVGIFTALLGAPFFLALLIGIGKKG